MQILRNPLLDAMVLSWARQVAALAKKELLLLLRAPKKSVTELVAPVLVVVLLGILNVSVSYPSPEVVQISEVFDRFSARPDSAGVAEWALHQASMEEVFLLIAHRAAEAHAAATSKAKDGAVDV